MDGSVRSWGAWAGRDADHWDDRCQAPYPEAGHDFLWAMGERQGGLRLCPEQPPRDVQRKAASRREQLGVGREHFAQGFVDATACQQVADLESRRGFAGARRAQPRQACCLERALLLQENR